MPKPLPVSLQALFAREVATAPAEEIVSMLVAEPGTPEGLASMRWLRANRPSVADEVLCLMYGLSWYQVGDLQPMGLKSSADPAKWFMAVDIDSDLNLDGIDDQDTPEALCAQAVRHLQLEQSFFGELTPA